MIVKIYLKEHYFDAISFMLEKVSETELLSFCLNEIKITFRELKRLWSVGIM